MTKYLFLTLIAVAIALSGCQKIAQDSDHVQSQQQETVLREGTRQVGMPAISTFNERRQLKMVYELRDRANIATYTYLVAEQTGQLVFFCNSVGFGIPAATQFTSPQKYVEHSQGGYLVLPQADPNGLFSPAAAEGTWVLCAPPNGGDPAATYVEPRIIVSQFPLGSDAVKAGQ